MKRNASVVHIAFQYGLNNTGGAAIAATRLHLALLANGVDSHYVCVRKREEGPQVYELPHGAARFVFLALAKLLRGIGKFSPRRCSTPLNLVPLFGLERLLQKVDPDVVHIHWLNADVMGFEQLGRLRRAFPRVRFVVNLHDLFMVNAIDAHPGSDRRYIDGFSRGDSLWVERWLFARKERAVRALEAPVPSGHAHPLAFVAPSEWAADCCRRSIIGRGAPAFAIPNLISSRFAFDPALRHVHSKFIVLYGAFGGRGNKSKGFSDLVQALALLPIETRRNFELHIFGEEAKACETAGVPTEFLGNIASPNELVTIYHGADVFAFPSLQETQGMTKVEAMLCGLPVIAFDRTACAEGIEPCITGSVAATAADFARGLMFWHDKWREGSIDHAQIAFMARKLSCETTILNSIKNVYSCLQ